MNWPSDPDPTLEPRVSQSTGCSRLCFTLAAIGISATTAAGLFT